jgi:hypothetical protein
MKVSEGRKLLLCLTTLLVAIPSAVFGQINYRWDRTAQVLGARSNVTVTAQGASAGGGLGRVFTDEDILPLTVDRSIVRDAFGGEGGGGGSQGAFGNLDGANGSNGVTLDGADGDLDGGQGGAAGETGFADSSGTARAIDELNFDGQTILSYAWIHNQWGDLELKGGGGGGGGGGGAHLSGLGGSRDGGNGGGGGGGLAAAGTITSVQDSDVAVTAECVWAPGFDPEVIGPFIDCSITLDMGWVSAANPDWSAAPWARSIDVTINAGNTVVRILGGPAGAITATGLDDNGNPFLKTSSALLSDNTGSFGFGAGEIGVTRTRPGDEPARIVSPVNAISSTLTGSLSAGGGSGGDGGGGDIDAPPAMHGQDGGDAGNGAGGLGGDGGAGANANAGDGGDGGKGEYINEHKDGIYQGLIEIRLG